MVLPLYTFRRLWAAAPLLALGLAAPLAARAQSVGIGTATPSPAAALEIKSTTQGLLLPRLSLVQRQALGTGTIAAPVPGLVIYQTDNNPGLYAFDGSAWVRIGADNLGDHTATQNLNLATNQLVGNGGSTGVGLSNSGAVQFGTNDADKIYFTQTGAANGSKLAHSTGWNLNYYAGPNNGLAGTHRFFTGTTTGWAERLRLPTATWAWAPLRPVAGST